MIPSPCAASSASAISMASESIVFGFHRTACDPMFQRHPVKELHGDECPPIMFTDVMDRADIRVIQRGCGLRFTPEAGKGLRIAGNVLRQELQSDKTTQPCVLGFVHNTHPPAAKSFNDSVTGDSLPDELRGSFHRREW